MGCPTAKILVQQRGLLVFVVRHDTGRGVSHVVPR